MGFRAADGGRRTDGIVVMEVPVYDPSGRKRKSHEWRREKRTKRYRREREGREEERESERERRGERAKRKRETGRTGEREQARERERRRRKHGEGRMTKLNYKSYELAALQPSPPAVLPSPSATSASSSPPSSPNSPFYLRSISTHPTDAILGFSPFFASLLLR